MTPEQNAVLQALCRKVFISYHAATPWAVARARTKFWTPEEALELVQDAEAQERYDRNQELKEKFSEH